MILSKYAFFILLSFGFLGVTPAYPATYQLLAPRPEAASRVDGDSPSKSATPRYHKRSGRVAFAHNFMALQKELRTDDVLELAFFEGEPLLIEVTSFSNNHNGTFTVNGRQLGVELTTFTMTFDAKSLVMTLQDIEKQTIYRLVGDMTKGGGEVVEVDQTQLPARLATPPRIPGKQEGGER